jgi:N-dimethylarginine dimethylaminohydrolase
MNFSPLASPHLLMCPPSYFAVTYSINPWMDPRAWADEGQALHAEATRQWAALHDALNAAGAAIETIVPEAGLPDLVFTANAAIVLDGKALLARFRHPERRNEQPVFAAGFRALQARGLIDELIEMPDGVALEGAGDCLWDRARELFWMGCGFRSDAAAAQVVEEVFGAPCLGLALADPSFITSIPRCARCRAGRSFIIRVRSRPGARTHPPPRRGGPAHRAHASLTPRASPRTRSVSAV